MVQKTMVIAAPESQFETGHFTTVPFIKADINQTFEKSMNILKESG
jgi:hypothetical protein